MNLHLSSSPPFVTVLDFTTRELNTQFRSSFKAQVGKLPNPQDKDL